MRLAVAVAMVAAFVAVASFVGRTFAAKRNAIAFTNARYEAERIQKKAVAWRSSHPLSCPTLADVGESPIQTDARIECSATTTTVRSAGADGKYFTADDPRYPEHTYDESEAP
jgi:hypothetical protein